MFVIDARIRAPLLHHVVCDGRLWGEWEKARFYRAMGFTQWEETPAWQDADA